MKKNFVKKLALGLALVMAVTSVPATSEAAAKPGFKSETVKVRVGQTKKYSTENSKKYSVKFKIGNKKVATIKYTAGSKSVKVTGVAEGKTTLRADFKSYSTKKVTTVKVPVKVLAAKVETPVVVEAELTALTQTASNAFTATFAADASQKFTKDSFSVAAADGSSVLTVKSVEFAADGLSAKVTLYNNFVDSTVYNVVCGEKTLPLTATVGAVTRIAITTASAQQNVETPIEFALYDATGIDVTSSVKVDTTCIVTISGTYTATDIAKASDATVTMANVGDKAEVTVIYNSNLTGAEDVTATQTITCVDAKVVKGTSAFVSNPYVALTNHNSGYVSKFYLGLSDQTATVAVNGTSVVDFCAKLDQYEAISYDSYEFESSNDDVVTVGAVSKDNGKAATFVINGNAVGSAQINVTATKNGKTTYYTIPVNVYEVGRAVKMVTSINKTLMSDVDDCDYYSTIKVELYDANNRKVNHTSSFEVTSKASTPITLSTLSAGPATKTTTDVFAAGADAKTHTVKVVASDVETGATFTRNVSVAVKKLPTGLLKLAYQVELSNAVIDENPINGELWTADDYTDARLYATCNGLFAGYVRNDGTRITVAEGSVTPTTETTITSAYVSAVYGTKMANPANDNLFDLVSLTTGSAITTTGKTTFNAVTSGTMTGKFAEAAGKTVYGPDSTDLAKTGNYTVKYALVINGKDVVKSAGLQVVNTVVAPKVAVTSKETTNLYANATIIEECLKTNVDMNNDTSAYASIHGLYSDKNGTLASVVSTTTAGDRVVIKYVTVEESYDLVDDGTTAENHWIFMVPVSATFKAE